MALLQIAVAILLAILVTPSIAASLLTQESRQNPVLEIRGLGQVRGTSGSTAWTGQELFKFYNIRYGQAPVGPLRFKAPVKVAPWNNVLDVSAPGPECPQPEGNLNNEDCLTLSVFSKNFTANYPVMVYIHGGSFYLGSAKYAPPEYLLEKDIVLVVVQYRLGALGFLSTLSNNIPGNAAMLDIILALQWVNEHIADFGGNPAKVTLFGQSAGAAAISGLLYSPIVPKNLFDQVILQSGGSQSTWALQTDPVGTAVEFARFAGCENAVLAQIEQCLMTVPAEALVKALPMHAAQKLSSGAMGSVGVNAMVVGGPSGFLQKTTYEYSRLNEVRQDIRMMGGVTKQDGSFVLTTVYDYLAAVNLLNDTKFIQFELIDAFNRMMALEDPSGALTAFEIESLFGEKELNSGNFTEMIDGLIDIAGAIVIKGPLLRDIQANVKHSTKETYLYTFDYDGQFTRFGYEQDTSHYPFKGGIHHSNDNIYLFPAPENVTPLSARDRRMAETMVELWTSFATDGIPKSSNVPEWPPVNSFIGPYMHINSPASVGQNFYHEFSVTARTNSAQHAASTSFSFLVLSLLLVLHSKLLLS